MQHIDEVLYGHTRCYVVQHTLLVDTDWAGSLQRFFKSIKMKYISLQNIKYIMVTHFHPDYMGIVQELVELGLQLIIFDVQKDAVHCSDYIFEKERNTDFKAIKEQDALYLRCDESRAFLEKIGIKGEVIATPGHSEDSVSLVLDQQCAIVGDLYPLNTVAGYNNPELEESWNILLSKALDTIYYSHPPADKITGRTHL